MIAVVVSSLLFPGSGIVRGLAAISSWSKFAKSPLGTAARAGALCMIVRSSSWRPRKGDIISDALLFSPDEPAGSENPGI
jgi:hypothetical protein